LLCDPALSAGQSPAAEPASTIQANTNLVVVDVVVTDAKHNPVHDLTEADFKVFENGQAQAIKTFEEHHTWEAAAPLPQVSKLSPGTFTNFTNAPASGALDILLLDALNTPMAAQSDVRNQMLKYLKETRPGTRMAIFGLTSRLILLQGFTSDPELLRDVLNGKKGLPKASIAIADQVNGDNPGADDPALEMAQEAADSMGNNPNAAQVAAGIQQFEAETQSFLLQTRAR
jgi:VWFA-related protein